MIIIHANQINPEIWEVWMRVLKRVNNSVLWLLKLPALAESNLKREAQRHGVDPSRIVFSDLFPMVCICSHELFMYSGGTYPNQSTCRPII